MASGRHIEKLPYQAALADACGPGDERHARAVRIHRLVEEAGERLDLLFAADHGNLHPLTAIERVGEWAQDLSHCHWRRLAADLAPLRLAEDECVAGSGVGALAGQDRSRVGPARPGRARAAASAAAARRAPARARPRPPAGPPAARPAPPAPPPTPDAHTPHAQPHTEATTTPDAGGGEAEEPPSDPRSTD